MQEAQCILDVLVHLWRQGQMLIVRKRHCTAVKFSSVINRDFYP